MVNQTTQRAHSMQKLCRVLDRDLVNFLVNFCCVCMHFEYIWIVPHAWQATAEAVTEAGGNTAFRRVTPSAHPCTHIRGLPPIVLHPGAVLNESSGPNLSIS